MKKTSGMKLLLMIIISGSVIYSQFLLASAYSEQIFITLKVNGNVIKTDVSPYMKGDRTYVPVRFVSESMRTNVEWFDNERIVRLTNADNTVSIAFTVGSSDFYVNGEKKEMDAPCEVVNARIMVPIRFIAENMNCGISWNQTTYTVEITKANLMVPSASIANRAYTDDDLIWLARIVSVEAKYCTLDAKIGIANVVINRTKSGEFPGSIYGVIFDTDWCVQFPPAHRNGFKDLAPPASCLIAAKMALEGVNNVGKSLFFNDTPFKSKALFKYIDGEYFYY